MKKKEKRYQMVVRVVSGGITEVLIIIYNIHANCLNMIWNEVNSLKNIFKHSRCMVEKWSCFLLLILLPPNAANMHQRTFCCMR